MKIAYFLIVTASLLNTNAVFAGLVSGILLGENQVTIKAKSQGELTAIRLDEGTPVKAGDVIAVIDDQQEKIELELALEEYKIASDDYKKTKMLSKYVSEEEITKKKNEFIKKKTAYELKNYNFNITRISSPIEGIITKKYFRRGETVSVGDKVFDIVQLDNLIMEIYITSREAMKLSIGQELNFKVDNNKGATHKAQVAYISPVIDPPSGTVKIKLTIKNPQREDRSYQFKAGTVTTVEL